MAKKRKSNKLSGSPSAKVRSSRREIHPWRLCPYGQHWVAEHRLRVPPSRMLPSGKLTTRSAHCAENPSHKDSLYSDEIREIYTQHFADLVGLPTPDALGFKNGNIYDSLIRGWTKYWNEVFGESEPLDPDLVKALIASESSFNPDVVAKVGKTKNRARGLMQVTDESQKILGDPDGELRDQLVHVDQKELVDPNLNICAGIRWLFRKKQIAESKAGHSLSWEEAIQEYKSEKQGKKLINRVLEYYHRLKDPSR